MSQLFPKWVNKLPSTLLLATIIFLTGLVGFVWYYFSPEFRVVGYQPEQPVPFSHQLHAGIHDIDCRYCHTNVDVAAQANIPPTETCMNCHSQIKTDSPRLAKVRESFKTGEPIEWVNVHFLPDYVYFNHAIHINMGVGCETCHGRVDLMKVVKQVEPLSMSWCLDCHENPAQYVRPVDEVTTMGWKVENQLELGRKLVAKHNIHPPTYCQGCHY